MNLVFGVLCLLAIGAWLGYVCRHCSGIRPLFALGWGAVLGIAALVAMSVMVDAVPERFAAPLGILFSVLVAGLVLLAVMRLLAALFSPASRASIAAHEVVHAVWFGAASIIVGVAFLAEHKMRTFLYSPNRWEVLWSRQPRYQGRTLAEWLPVLRTDTNRTEHPLRIVRVIHNYEPECDGVEVPLSCDLMRKYGLLELDLPSKGYKPPREDTLMFRHARLYLLVNGDVAHEGPLCWRATNGNCLVCYHQGLLKPGTNEIEVKFSLFTGDSVRSATGPPTQVELSQRGLVPVMNNSKWHELGFAMFSLGDLRPKWRTKDVESGFIREWDGKWFDRFYMSQGYAYIEWLEIEVASTEQDAAVGNALKALHVPGEKTEHGYRVFGYAEPGKLVNYIE